MSEETQQIADQTTETPVVETQAEEPKVHPAYEKLLSELPEAWHQKVTPHLQEQDKYFQQQLEKYTPFKKYVEEGIPVELIEGGLSLARSLEEDPVDTYVRLQSYLKQQGMLPEEAQQAAKDAMEEASGEDFDDLFDGEEVPKALKKELDALRAKTEEVENWRNEQQLAKDTEEYTMQLDADMARLREVHTINPAHEKAIYNLMDAALASGREITVAQAAKELSDMIGGLPSAQPQGGEPAPMVIGSAGGAGVIAPDLSIPKDSQGKKEMLVKMMEEYRRANQ
jgi:hypothetical protein